MNGNSGSRDCSTDLREALLKIVHRVYMRTGSNMSDDVVSIAAVAIGYTSHDSVFRAACELENCDSVERLRSADKMEDIE